MSREPAEPTNRIGQYFFVKTISAKYQSVHAVFWCVYSFVRVCKFIVVRSMQKSHPTHLDNRL